jgi:hypothetical protein
LRRLENEIRAILKEASERADLRRDARTKFFAEPFIPHGTRLTHLSGDGEKGQRRSLGQDWNQFLDSPLAEDLSITISVIEGPSNGLVYEMREHCITLGRTFGGADFQFDEPEASEIQCILATRQNGVCLYDAASIHGTYVNDQRIAAAELTDMSTFRVGSSLLLIKVHWNLPADVC